MSDWGCLIAIAVLWLLLFSAFSWVGKIILLIILAAVIALFVAMMIVNGKRDAKQREEQEARKKELEALEKERQEKLWQLQKRFAIIDQMDGDEFEQFTAELLRRYGFQNVSVTRASGDYGVDVIAYKDGVKCAVQCKRYSGKLGLRPVQEVHSGMAHYGASVGVVVTNSHFTENAKRLAKETGIHLWDRNAINYIITEIEKAASVQTDAEKEL